MGKEEQGGVQGHMREQVKSCFRDGAYLNDIMLSEKISRSLSDRRNHEKEKIRKYLAALKTPVVAVKEKGC